MLSTLILLLTWWWAQTLTKAIALLVALGVIR